MIGEYLYGLTEKDARTQPVLQRFTSKFTLTGLNVLLSPQFPPVPNDKIFVLTNMVVHALAGAAQTCTGWRVDIEDETGALITTIAREVGTAALERAQTYVGLNVMLMANEHLEADVNFNLAGASNEASLFACGYFIPKGNLQQR